LTRAVPIALVALLIPYAWAPQYRFPDPAPFAGAEWLNPYAGAPAVWQRANLHAHGRAWSGFTNGRQPDDQIAQRYRELGYDVPGVSDYQEIAVLKDRAAIPLYEHGYNIGKHHQLAIGARRVAWFDFPLWQSPNQQQFVIDRVKRTAELVALAHPNSRYAYSNEDLQQLTGYDLIEVVNGPFTAEDSWDTVLSSGRLAWGIANDDTHDLTDPHRTAAAWNMIAAPTARTPDIIAALRSGQSYSVLRTGTIDAAGLTSLSSVEIEGRTLSVGIAGAASSFTFVGQNGTKRKTIKDAMSAEYRLTPADTYVRVVVESPQTVLFLNPVVRYDGRKLVPLSATVDVAATWTLRGGFLVACAVWALFVRRRRVEAAMSSALLPKRA
jgi:hypothetical protein